MLDGTSTTTTTTTGNDSPGRLHLDVSGFSLTTGASCASTTTTTTSGTTGLSGGEGSIDNFKIVGATNTSLNEGDNDTVYGFEFKEPTALTLSGVNRVDYDVYNSNSNQARSAPWNRLPDGRALERQRRRSHRWMSLTQSDVYSERRHRQPPVTTWAAALVTRSYRIRFDNLNDVVKEGTTVDYYLKLYTDSGISDQATRRGCSTTDLARLPQGLRATDAEGIQQYTTTNTSTNSLYGDCRQRHDRISDPLDGLGQPSDHDGHG